MTSSVSLEMPPRTTGFGLLTLDSQFLYRAKYPPKSTNLNGQTGIITGASTGIGLESCHQFLGLGLSRLILAVRSQKKGDDTAAALRKAFPKARVDVWILEMESYKSVQAFAARVDAELPRIDITILNAGMLSNDFELSKETGHERVVQVNYLSTFLLTILLLPILKAKAKANGTSPARLTVVGSGAALASKHGWQDQRPLLPAFDDLNRIPWNFGERYWSSKLLGQLFFTKLYACVDPDDVILNLVDPGLVKNTSLQRGPSESSLLLAVAIYVVTNIAGRSVKSGASSYVDAAVMKGKESHGCFIMDWELRPFAKFIYSPKGKDCAEVLWKETMAELKFAGVEDILANLKK
ncbi:hypothetical protein Sste5346_008738 [Sporothrix stenoceras]|uniref:Short-chain dehydrogenase/reductase family protein n=1 Tax=Sporothrix stenoceras TaxID=5173 RepID=A0ABR3YN17_9PEZI